MNVVNFVRWANDLPPASALPHAGSVWLEWRNWDDFGWKVTFVAYVPVSGKWESPGTMSLSLLDRQSAQPVRNTWDAMRQHQNTPNPEESLDLDWYASLGSSLDYYVWFQTHDAIDLLIALADLMIPNAPLARWRRYEVFGSAFGRGSDIDKVLTEATDLITGARPDLVDLSFRYAFTPDGEAPPVEVAIRFDPTSRPRRRVSVIVGPNGAGKTSLLFAIAADFARFSDQGARERFIRPPKRIISRQVIVTNNPFDLPRRSVLPEAPSLSVVGLRYSPPAWDQALRSWEQENQHEAKEKKDSAWIEWLWNRFPSPEALRREAPAARLSEPDHADLQILRDVRQDWSRVLDGIIRVRLSFDDAQAALRNSHSSSASS